MMLPQMEQLKYLNRNLKVEHKNVRLLIKPKNAGVTHRYEEGIRSCCGVTMIFLCDQDDVWEEKKLERMKDVFKETDAKLVFSDARCIDSSGDSLGYNLWDQMGFNKAERLQMMEGKGMLVTVRHNVASACCMAFRNSLKRNILAPHCSWKQAFIARSIYIGNYCRIVSRFGKVHR